MPHAYCTQILFFWWGSHVSSYILFCFFKQILQPLFNRGRNFQTLQILQIPKISHFRKLLQASRTFVTTFLLHFSQFVLSPFYLVTLLYYPTPAQTPALLPTPLTGADPGVCWSRVAWSCRSSTLSDGPSLDKYVCVTVMSTVRELCINLHS